MTCPLLNVLNMLYKEEMWDTAVAYKGKKMMCSQKIITED